MVPLFLGQEALGKHDRPGVARELQVAQLHMHVDQRPAVRVGRRQRWAWPRCLEILERADQGWGSLIGPMDFANAARSPAGTFGVTDVAPSGAFLDACTCWKTRLAMNSRNGV